MLLAASASGHAQTAGGQALFGLEKRTDSLYVLTLKTDSTDEEHQHRDTPYYAVNRIINFCQPIHTLPLLFR